MYNFIDVKQGHFSATPINGALECANPAGHHILLDVDSKCTKCLGTTSDLESKLVANRKMLRWSSQFLTLIMNS